MRNDGDYVPIAVYNPFGPYDEKGRPYWKVITKLAHKTSGAVIKRTARAYSAKEAEDLRAEVVKLLQAGFEPAAKTVTIGELLNLWRAQEEAVKPLTPNRRYAIRGLETNIRMHLPDLNMPLHRAVGRIKASYEQWSEAPSLTSGQPKSPRTLKQIYRLLTRLFQLAVAKPRRWLDKNPMDSVDRPTGRNPTPHRRRLTTTEALKLWAFCRDLVEKRSLSNPHWRVGVQIALMLGGLRVGELMDAQVRGLDRGRGGQILRLFHGKTVNAAREVPLFNWLLAAVTELCQGKGALDPIFQRGGTQSEPLIGASSISCAVLRICKRAGVTVVSPHGLRRTFTDLQNMVSERAFRDMARAQTRSRLGHAVGSSTMETAYMSPERRREAEMLDVGNVFAWLDRGGEALAEPVAMDPDLLRLVERLGGLEQAKALLETVSGSFPTESSGLTQPRKN